MWSIEQTEARSLEVRRHPSVSGRRSLAWLCGMAALLGTGAVAFAQDRVEGGQPPGTTQPAQRQESQEVRPATTREPADAIADQNDDQADAEGLRVFWKDTLRFESPDKNFRLKLGGRIQWDLSMYDARGGIEEIGDFDDGTEIRRARFYYSGTFHKRFEFKTQIELSQPHIEAKDVYIGLLDLPIGNLRLGHFKEPFGLNELTSSKYLTFMERSQTTDTFALGRNTGIMLHDHALGERMTWAVGFFRATDEFFNGEISDGLHLTGRVTALPWYEEDGRKLLHVGVAWSHRDPGGDHIDLDARPGSHLAPKHAAIDDIEADSVDLLGLEAALVHGPFSLQGEYIHAFINRKIGGELQFNSFYIQASYFLTGEHRNYETDVAEFGRIRPKHNYGEDHGMGAWEIAMRYVYLDLIDDDIRGGRVSDLSVGLNWYLNPNARVAWNYVYTDTQDSGFVNIFQMRFQLAF